MEDTYLDDAYPDETIENDASWEEVQELEREIAESWDSEPKEADEGRWVYDRLGAWSEKESRGRFKDLYDTKNHRLFYWDEDVECYRIRIVEPDDLMHELLALDGRLVRNTLQQEHVYPDRDAAHSFYIEGSQPVEDFYKTRQGFLNVTLRKDTVWVKITPANIEPLISDRTELLAMVNSAEEPTRLRAAKMGLGLAKLASDGSVRVRRAVAANGYDPETMAAEKDWRVRAGVASAPDTPPEILDKLMRDRAAGVRREVALKKHGIELLVKDSDPIVRAAVAESGMMLRELVKDKDADVRVAVAERGYGLDKLIKDKDPYVRKAVGNYLEGMRLSPSEKADIADIPAGSKERAEILLDIWETRNPSRSTRAGAYSEYASRAQIRKNQMNRYERKAYDNKLKKENKEDRLRYLEQRGSFNRSGQRSTAPRAGAASAGGPGSKPAGSAKGDTVSNPQMRKDEEKTPEQIREEKQRAIARDYKTGRYKPNELAQKHEAPLAWVRMAIKSVEMGNSTPVVHSFTQTRQASRSFESQKAHAQSSKGAPRPMAPITAPSNNVPPRRGGR